MQIKNATFFSHFCKSCDTQKRNGYDMVIIQMKSHVLYSAVYLFTVLRNSMQHKKWKCLKCVVTIKKVMN